MCGNGAHLWGFASGLVGHALAFGSGGGRVYMSECSIQLACGEGGAYVRS